MAITTSYSWSHGSTKIINDLFVDGSQVDPAIASNPAGDRYFAAWTDPDNNGQVMGRIVDSNGTPISSEFIVNQSANVGSTQDDPSVAGLTGGRFVVTYVDYSADAGGDIRGRLYNASGTPHGADFVIDAGGAFDDTQSSVTALSGGGFVVTYTRGIAGNVGIRARVFDENGNDLSGSFVVDSGSAQWFPTIASLADGGFVVTWQDNSSDEVYFRRFEADGTPLDPDRVLMDTIGTSNHDVHVVGLSDGGFAVAYTDNGWSIDGTEITFRIYDADGSPRTGAIRANNAEFGGIEAGNQNLPTITTMGELIVVGWHDANSNTARAQVFDAQGNALGENANFGSSVVVPEVAGLAGSQMATVWRSDISEGLGLGDSIRHKVSEFMRVQTGDAEDNTIVGIDDGVHERLSGGNGNDVLKGGGGGDELWGGLGSDTASYQMASSGVMASLEDASTNVGDAAGDSYFLVENLLGSSYGDALTGDSGNNNIDGGAGNDVLKGGGGVDAIDGGIGDDTIYGDAGDDMIDGGAGNDTIEGGAGADMIEGGDGDDTIVGGSGVSMIHGGAGNDVIVGGGDVDQIDGGSGNDTIDGGAGDDTINGGEGNDTIAGGEGNDSMAGGPGNDLLDGGAGDDSAVFSMNFNDYIVQDFGAMITVTGPDGVTTLRSVEHLQFANATITPAELADDGSVLFDTLYYLSTNPDVFAAGVNALNHYNAFGWHEGRNPNALFDTAAYNSVSNEAAAASGMNPLDHYHQTGWQQGLDPSASFDTELYLLHNPDVAALGIDPLAHYLHFGAAEGRQAYAAVGQNVAGGFDAEYYVWHNPDVAAAGVDPREHYDNFGRHEGRDPNAWFDTDGYLSHYGDVAAAGINPLEHYMAFGWQEGRDPSAAFDTDGYLAANPDVAAAGFNPLDHFLQFGIYEGRQAVNDGVWG